MNVSEGIKKLTDDLNKRIEELWGDDLELLSKDYVFEERPLEIQLVDSPMLDGTIILRAHCEYRVRPKTAEERLHDRADDIIAKHTVVGRCISCRGDIFSDQPYEDTIHGLYHTGTRRCMEGRD